MSLPEDSPVSPSAWPGSDWQQTIHATDGPQQSIASAWYDQNGRCWKTFQACLLLDISEPFLENWPKAGSIVDGAFYRQPKWERRINGIGSGLWHTPNVPNGGRVNPPEMSPTGILPNGQKRQVGLEHQVRMVERQMWPTPTKAVGLGGPGNSGRDGGDNLRTAVAKALPTPNARDWRSGKGRQDNGHSPQLPEVIGGQLNPTWVEWLMGWPLGWTDLQPLAMDKFRQWCEQHGC